MLDRKYNVLDLFCGAGDLSYGFERAGFNVLLGIDNDAKALETLRLTIMKQNSFVEISRKLNMRKISSSLLTVKQ